MCVHDFLFAMKGRGRWGNSENIFIKGLISVHSDHLLSFVQNKHIICVM